MMHYHEEGGGKALFRRCRPGAETSNHVLITISEAHFHTAATVSALLCAPFPASPQSAAACACRPRPVRCMASAAASEWLQQDVRRPLHAVYRVNDMNAHVDYYQKHFGMKVLRMRDVPEEKYTNAFLGYGSEDKNFVLELTANYGKDQYDLGDFGHFGLAMKDVYGAAKRIKADGGVVSARTDEFWS